MGLYINIIFIVIIGQWLQSFKRRKGAEEVDGAKIIQEGSQLRAHSS